MKDLKKILTLLLIIMTICCWQLPYAYDHTAYGSSGNTVTGDPIVSNEPQEPAESGGAQEPIEPDGSQEPSVPEEPQQPVTPDEGTSGSGSDDQPSAPSTGTSNSGSSSYVSSGSGAANSGMAVSSGGNYTASQSSSDTRLSELQINCGQLVPEFSPDQYNYTVYVEYDGEPIGCGTSAVGMDPSVSIRAEGPTEIIGEDAQKRVIAEAGDGSYSEYIIDIHVVKDNELLINNALYVISEPQDIDSLPGDYQKDEVEFASETVRVARSSDDNVCLLYYVNTADENDVLWYILNEDTEKTYQAVILEYDGQQYLSLSPGNDLVYGVHDGVLGYFIIDPATGEILFSLSGSANPENTSALSANNWIIIGAAAVIVLLAACCTFICRKFYLRAKANEKQEKKYFRPYLSPDAEYMAEKDGVKEQADHK